jgi:hypothetical protein
MGKPQRKFTSNIAFGSVVKRWLVLASVFSFLEEFFEEHIKDECEKSPKRLGTLHTMLTVAHLPG